MIRTILNVLSDRKIDTFSYTAMAEPKKTPFDDSDEGSGDEPNKFTVEEARNKIADELEKECNKKQYPAYGHECPMSLK